MINCRSKNQRILIQNLSKIRSFVVQLARSAFQISVPGFVPISTPPNCFNWCSTDASGTLSGHFWSAPGTLQVVPEHSLGALGCLRRVPGPISDRFLMPRGPNLLKNLSKIRIICGPACSKCDPNFGSWICSNSDPSKLLHLVLNGRFRDALGALLERAGDAPGRPRALLGRPGVPQEGPGTDF